MGGTEPLAPPIEVRRIFSEKHARRSRRLARFGRVCTRSRSTDQLRLVPHMFSATPGSSVLSKALGGWSPEPPRRYGQSFFGGDGIAESPSGVIYADASPFPFLAFYCIVELAPSGTAKALFKS